MRLLALALLSMLIFPVSVRAADTIKDNDPNETSCGPTALFVVARALGTDITLSEAAGKLRTEHGLTTLSDMKRAIVELGLHAKAFTPKPGDLDSLRCPAILRLKRGGAHHFVVVLGVRPADLLVADPLGTSGWHDRKRTTDPRLWDGTALLVSRSEKTIDRFGREGFLMSALAGAGSTAMGIALVILGVWLGRRRRRRGETAIAGLTLLAALVLASSSVLRAAEPESSPASVKFEKAEVFLGKTNTPMTLKGRLILKNDGDCTVTVEKLRSTCRCIVSEVKDAPILAGGTLVIPVSLSSSSAGLVEGKVYVHLKGYDEPLTATLKGEFKAGVSFDPPTLLFQVAPAAGDERSLDERFVTFWAPDRNASITVEAADDGLLVREVARETATRDDSGLQAVAVFAVAARPADMTADDAVVVKSVKFRIRYQPAEAEPLPAGSTDSSALVQSQTEAVSEAETCLAELKVRIFAAPAIRVAPKCLVFILKGAKDLQKRTVTIQTAKGDLTVLRVDNGMEESLEVKVDSVAAGAISLHVTPRPGCKQGTGTIRVHVNESQVPIEIPVTIFR